MKTFEAFLKEAIAKNADVRLRPMQYTPDAPVTFYAHLLDHNGSTVDFEAHGDMLVPRRGEGGLPAPGSDANSGAQPNLPQAGGFGG